MIKKRILRESARVDTAKYGKYGYGGNNRTEQISEILESNGFHSQFITLNHPTKLINRLKNAWLLKNKYNFRFKKSKFLIGYIGHVFENYLHEFKNFEGERIFIQEEPPSFLAYHAAKMCGFKIITMPHNIETMMYGYNEDFFTKEEFPLNVYNELKFIGVSDLVFCISREEQWLLNNLRIPSGFLPYYPPQKKMDEMLQIRELRMKSNKSDEYLIISTVENPATINSLDTQIKLLEQVQNEIPLRVRLIGYGTEKLKPSYAAYGFLEVEGTVTPERMRTLTSQCKAALIHQNTGPGALTKIPELLLGGVPVIANAHAARSSFGYHDVLVYDDTISLQKCLIAAEKIEVAEMISPPTDHISSFINQICRLI